MEEIIKYMGDDPKAKYKYDKGPFESDNLALYELMHMNLSRDKGLRGYMGAELLFRVHGCSDSLYKELKPSLDVLEKAFKVGLDSCGVSKNNEDELVRNGVAMCCEVTPQIREGKPRMDIFIRYINFNPWANDNLFDNKICNGRPKTLELSGGIMDLPPTPVHIGYFPHCSLNLIDVDVRNFHESFVEKFKSAMPYFRNEAQKDFNIFGKSFYTPDGLKTNTMTTLVTTCAAMGSVIKMQLDEKREKEKALKYSPDDTVWVIRRKVHKANGEIVSKVENFKDKDKAFMRMREKLDEDIKKYKCSKEQEKKIRERFYDSLHGLPFSPKYSVLSTTEMVVCEMKEERVRKAENAKTPQIDFPQRPFDRGR